MAVVRLKFEPRDVWLGAYFDTVNTRVYICVVPMFPIIIEGSTAAKRALERLRDGGGQLLREDMVTGVKLYLETCRDHGLRPRLRYIVRNAFTYAAFEDMIRRDANVIPFSE